MERHRLVGHAELVSEGQKLPPLRRGKRHGLVEFLQVAHPITKSFASRDQVVAALGAPREVVRDERRHHGGRKRKHGGNRVYRDDRNGDSRDSSHTGHDEEHLLRALARSLEEVALLARLAKRGLPCAHRLDKGLGLIDRALLQLVKRAGVAKSAMSHKNLQRGRFKRAEASRRRSESNRKIPGGSCVFGGIARLDAQHTLMRKPHHRRREVAHVIVIPAPKTPRHRRLQTLFGNFPIVLPREIRRVFPTPAGIGDRRCSQNRRAHDSYQSEGREKGFLLETPGIGPRLLFGNRIIEPRRRAIREHLLAVEVREPRCGEQHVGRCVLTGVHHVVVEHDRSRRINRNRTVLGTMPPRAHRIVRDDGLPLSDGKRNSRRDVFRGHRPIERDVGPVRLGDILVGKNRVRDGVVEFHDYTGIGHLGKSIERVLRVVVRIRCPAGGTPGKPFIGKRGARKRLPVTLDVPVGIGLSEAHAVDLYARRFGEAGERPADICRIALEIEDAVLNDPVRSVCFHLHGDVGFRARVRAGSECNARRCRHQSYGKYEKASCEQSSERNRWARRGRQRSGPTRHGSSVIGRARRGGSTNDRAHHSARSVRIHPHEAQASRSPRILSVSHRSAPCIFFPFTVS